MYANIKPLIKLKKELNLLDYIVPNNLKVESGQLVEIPFRNRNIYGVVFDIKNTTNQPKHILKPVGEIISETPLFSQNQIEFYKFFIEHNFSSLNFLNNITPLPLKRKTQAKEEKINVNKINWNLKNIPETILKNKQFIFKHTYFSEKISLIKKTIDTNKKQTLIISPTKLHLEKIYSHLLNFYKSQDIAIITGYTHLNKTEHNKVWHDIQDNKVKIILGTKVSIFYPTKNIDSIIVDEIESENHNQTDINPRFEFLPNILELSKINNCQLILTSYSPPSTLYNLAQEKKIKLLESKTKINTEITIPEMNIKYFENQIHFNTEEYIDETLKNKGKILFLMNKKGHSKSLTCPDCKLVFKCPDCTAIPGFKTENTLYCYGCQKEIETPLKCPKCGNSKLKTRGIGLTQLYSKVKGSFPEHPSIMIDKEHEDNLKLIKKNQIVIATKVILNHLHEKEFDLIILPLTHQFLNSNFDSNEKFYQFTSRLISLKPKKLILQVLNELKIYDYIRNQSYYNMIKDELEFRKLFKYPPFYNMLKITVKDKDQKILNKRTNELYSEIENVISNDIELIPIIEPRIKKTFSFYLKYIMLKYKSQNDVIKLKKILDKIDIINKNYFKL
jgi:primosomal protein N' (replication factor Y) (superfamily II helicase)